MRTKVGTLCARFDVAALRELAGERVFARGEAYFHDGQVEIISALSGSVLARVAGTEVYRIRLTGEGAAIGGDCTCPAFDDRGMCKHMVAAALAVNGASDDAEATGAGGLARIREYLEAKGVEALAEMVLQIAERDAALWRRLEIAAAALQDDDGALAGRLRKVIDQATRTRGYVDYHEASAWAADVEAALDAVEELVAGGRATLALQLVERAIERIEQAIGSIDDSDGGCGDLLARCRDIHLAAAAAARPEPVGLAAALFTRELSDDYGVFAGAAELYAEVLGERGLAEYRRLAAEAWSRLPPRAGRAPTTDAADLRYGTLKAILDPFFERDGDVEARIALRAKDLTSPWSYLQLAEFCLAQGREAEALRRAEEGLWLFEDDRPDERLVAFAAGLLDTAGRGGEALELLMRSFEKAPSLDLYAMIARAGGEAGRTRAFEILKARLAASTPNRWTFMADLPVRILLQEKAFDAAWAMVREHGASVGVREALARASEASHPQEAAWVYEDRVLQLVAGGGDPAYREAVELVERMAALRSASDQAAYVTALKARFGRKRNFMRLLG